MSVLPIPDATSEHNLERVAEPVGPVREVVLVTEGTYPHGHGGVSVWCDQIVRGLAEQPFTVVALTAFGYQRPVWDLPPNVQRLLTVGLWDHARTAAGRARRISQRGRRSRGGVSPLAASLAVLLTSPREEVSWFGGLIDRLSGLDPAEIAEQLSFPQILRALDAELRTSSDAWAAVRPAHASDLVVVAGMLDHLLRPLGIDPGPAALYHASSNGLAALVCLVANRRHGVPFVLTEHGIYLRERYLELRRLPLARPARAILLRFHRLVTATAYARAAVVAPGSRWNVRWESRHGTPADVLQTIYNGIEPDEFAARDAEPPEPVVSWLGRIDPIKDLETLVGSFAVVHEKRPDARLRLYGRTPPSAAPYREQLEAQIAELGLEDVVTFEGGVGRSADAYADAQVGVLSSISEGFPYSLIEAMACGLPAVATGVGGVEEAVADTGLVVVPRSPELLGDAIVELLDDGPRRRRLGVAARARVLEHFTVQSCLDAYRDLYAGLPGTFRVPRLRAVPVSPTKPPACPRPRTRADRWTHVSRRPDDAARRTGADIETAGGFLRRPGTPSDAPDSPIHARHLSARVLRGRDRLDPDQRAELVAAVGGPEALAQALDVDEVAATLESVGVTDRIAELRFDSPDVFDVAARLWDSVDHAEPPRQVPPPRPQPDGALGRGIAYVLPAVVVAAAVIGGADQAALVAASIGAWGVGQSAGVLAFTAMHRAGGTADGPQDLGPLRRGLTATALGALMVGLLAHWLRGLGAGLSAALPLLYLVGATGLIVAGRTRVLLQVLTPLAALSVVVVVRPRPSAASLVAPTALLTVAVLLAIVGWSAWSSGARRSPGDLLHTADWVASLPLAVAGWATAAFALLAVSSTSHVPGLARPDDRQWLLLALPLWVVVAGSEWFILAARRALAAELEASDSIVGFRRAAQRLVGRRTLLGALGLTAAALVGALGAAAASGIPVVSAVVAASVFAAVAAALFGATVMVSARQLLPVFALVAASATVLAVVALTAHNPGGVSDHWIGVAVATGVAAVLCVGAGRALTDPSIHR